MNSYKNLIVSLWNGLQSPVMTVELSQDSNQKDESQYRPSADLLCIV